LFYSHQKSPKKPTMIFSSALISFLSSLSTAASVAMAMEESHDSVLHDITASILEESFKVKYNNKNKKNQENTPSPFSKIKTSNNKYKKLMSHLEPLKIQNSNDGRRYKASGTIADLADDKGDIMQKKDSFHHLVEHQQHQEGKSLEECNSDHDSLMKQKVSSYKESITKIDFGYLNRGTCSSPKDVCVPQDKAIEGDGAFLEPEDASYASSGYCVPLSALEDMEYFIVVASTIPFIDKEEFNKEKEINNSYYHYHPQYDHHHRQLDLLNCTAACPDPRPDVSTYLNEDKPFPFRYLINNCYNNEVCPSDDDDINCWNTAGITDMANTFARYFGPDLRRNYFNDPLECWDVGQVTTMHGMFSYSNFNQPIDAWNVSQVSDMGRMFIFATSFNQAIGDWNTSQVSDMSRMFIYATSFNQAIGDWNTSQVSNMKLMFYSATSFNQAIGNWNTSQISDMYTMFNRATSFNQAIGSWDVSQVEVINGMFSRAEKFNQPIDSWNVSQVSDMGRMFYSATSFNKPIGDWNTSKVDFMDAMFLDASKFNQPIDSWNVSQVKFMTRMFYRSENFNQCLSTWAGKTPDIVDTFLMLVGTDCPNGIGSPNATIGPWCQNYTQGCFASGFEPSQQPSDLPSNKPTDKPSTNAPTNSPTTKSQKKKSIKKTKKRVKKKSKKM
jgi:surface protein